MGPLRSRFVACQRVLSVGQSPRRGKKEPRAPHARAPDALHRFLFEVRGILPLRDSNCHVPTCGTEGDLRWYALSARNKLHSLVHVHVSHLRHETHPATFSWKRATWHSAVPWTLSRVDWRPPQGPTWHSARRKPRNAPSRNSQTPRWVWIPAHWPPSSEIRERAWNCHPSKRAKKASGTGSRILTKLLD